ncbi:MAG: restriction endonuclease subunit S [Thermodesulfobacteriota bacterium]
MAGEDWKMVPVSQICNIHIGGTPRREEPSYWGGSIKWASAKDVASCRSRYLRETEETITQKGLKESAAKLLDKDTIVITARGTVGAMCMLPDPMSFNQTCYGLIARPQVDPVYLYYALKAALKRILTLTYGTVFETITIKSFDKIEVPLPALKIQRAVAHILGSLDDKIELNRKTNETLEAMAIAIFKSWFVNFDPVRAKAEGRNPGLPKEIAALFPDEFEDSELGEIPGGWRVGKTDELFNISRETVSPEKFSDEIFDHYSIPAFDEGRWPKAETGSAIKSNKNLVSDVVVLISKLNPRIPRVWLPTTNSERRAIASTEFLIALPHEAVTREFLYFLFSSQAFIEVFATLVTGTSGSHQRVKPEYLLNMQVVVPPMPLVNQFTTFVNPILLKVAQNLKESQTLAAIRDALLPKLISGEIRVKDAEKLLEVTR